MGYDVANHLPVKASARYPAAMPAPAPTQLRKAATRFLEAEPPIASPEELPQLLGRCAVHLVTVAGGGLDGAEAREIATVAWADITGRESRVFVDLDTSTPHIIFLKDGLTGRRRAIPVIDLVRWLGPRVVAPPQDLAG
jgi:hypothetical protein